MGLVWCLPSGHGAHPGRWLGRGRRAPGRRLPPACRRSGRPADVPEATWRQADDAQLASKGCGSRRLSGSETAKRPTAGCGRALLKPGERLCGQGRGRTADLPIFSRTLVPTELPGRATGSSYPGRRRWSPDRVDVPRNTNRRVSKHAATGVAVLTGLEPATSALTGRRALQLLHRTSVLRRPVGRLVPPTGFEPVLPP